jgi:hypothetical protein
MEVPVVLKIAWAWIVLNRWWFYSYMIGMVVTRLILRYAHRDTSDYGGIMWLWPLVLTIGTIWMVLWELPRRFVLRVVQIVQDTRIDRAFDFAIWWLFKRRIDAEDKIGVLYQGPGPRELPIHRLRVVDPGTGQKYWLTVPRSESTARSALAWTWDAFEDSFPAARHV